HQAEAFAALDAAAQRYPGNETFLRQKIFYLIDLKLYQKAAALGETYLETANAQVADYLAIGRALRQSGQLERARDFLEGARLQYPDNVKLTVELAQVYLQLEHTAAAAHLYEQAAFQDPTYMNQAAELYRKAGKLFVALNLNARVPEPKEKLKQRLAILLELENYAMAASMRDDLVRADLLSNEAIRYALAYAQFKDGQFKAAEANLQRLTQSDLFRKATELRKAMAECRDAAWKCY
ncbi:MAG: tetratricopeptide repeat protein, partial [Thiohalorhabdaceae bacterium]